MSHIDIRRQLLDLLPISDEQLHRLITRSPHTYKQYKIPKKSGGFRTISQPSRGTKYLQYWLMENVFNELVVHKSAAAYQKGSSIKKNASYHAKNSFIAKFDFRNFFPSIKGADLIHHMEKQIGNKLSNEDLNDIVRISCIKQNGKNDFNLSIGAPSSPLLSNSMLYEFDCQVVEWCNENKIRYTRYADDLTFSTNMAGITSSIEPFIRYVKRNLKYPTLRFNRQKTTHLSKKHQRRVTGLILTNDGSVSIGRSRKREISSLIHTYTINQLVDDELFRLQGLLGFAKGVEPDFLNRMRKKYGGNVITAILQLRK